MLLVYFFLSLQVILLNLNKVTCDQNNNLNNYPIIGVFTQPSTSEEGNCHGKCLYLAASYVKYLESSGARVVPINYYATNSGIYIFKINYICLYHLELITYIV